MKTKISKNLLVTRPLEFIKNNPEAGLSLKVFWFGLEESKTEFMLSIMSNYLYNAYGYLYDTDKLMSFQGELPDEILSSLETEEAKQFFSDFEKKVEVIDYETNSFGIYKHVRDYALRNGKLYVTLKDERIEVTPFTDANNHMRFKDAEDNEYKYFTDYVPNNPDEYVIVVIDHISLISTEKSTPTLHGSMSKLSYDYLRMMLAKRFNYIPVAIQQQSADMEGIENIKAKKLEPSLRGLADNKLLGRDLNNKYFCIILVLLYIHLWINKNLTKTLLVYMNKG